MGFRRLAEIPPIRPYFPGLGNRILSLLSAAGLPKADYTSPYGRAGRTWRIWMCKWMLNLTLNQTLKRMFNGLTPGWVAFQGVPLCPNRANRVLLAPKGESWPGTA